jgi:hypothetical protein
LSTAVESHDQERSKFTTVEHSTLQQSVEFTLRLLGPTTLVTINPVSNQIAALWIENASADVLRWAESCDEAGGNAYFTANRPRQRLSKKPEKSEIVECRCLYSDGADAARIQLRFDAFAPSMNSL